MMESTDSMIILNQYKVGGHEFLLFLSIAVLVVLVIVIIIAINNRCTYGEWDSEVILYIITAIVCFGILFSGWLIPQINSYMVYEVYFSEDASLQDFLEKYEIISQEGEIYTIKQKE